ncbi:hypothetical protein D3C87_662840 [compost metagenome]
MAHAPLFRIREVEPDALSTAATVSVKLDQGQLRLPMCGACATPTVSVKLNLVTQTAATVSVKLE